MIDCSGWDAEVKGFLPDKISFEVKSLRDFLGDGVFKGIIAMVGGLEPEDREDVFLLFKGSRNSGGGLT